MGMTGMDSWCLQRRQTCWMTWIHSVQRIGTCCLAVGYCLAIANQWGLWRLVGLNRMESIGGEVSCAIMFDDNRWFCPVGGFAFPCFSCVMNAPTMDTFFRFGDKRASIGRQDLLFFGRRSL